MKYFIVAILLSACLFSIGQARIIEEPVNHTDKRFISEIWDAIQDTIFRPIKDQVIDPISTGVEDAFNTIVDGTSNIIDIVVDGVTTAVEVIADPFVQFGNDFIGVIGSVDTFFSETLVNAVEDAVNVVKDNTLEIINVAGLILNPGSVPDLQLVDEDPCEATCSIGIKDKATGEVTKYMFDQPNGCIAKGYAPDNKINTFFNNCCDDHNTCLNAQVCCTDTKSCQDMKNKCDTAYFSCVRKACKPYYDDDQEFFKCSAMGSSIVGRSRNQTCASTETRPRRLCRC